MNSVGNSPFGFNYQAMAERQQALAQGQLDYQKQSDTATKAQETSAGGGALQSLTKGIKGVKDLKNKISGGMDSVGQLADRLEGKFNDLKGQLNNATGGESTKPTPSNGEEYDMRDANSELPSGVKPLDGASQGGLGESSGTIGEMNPSDFSMARGQIQSTLQSKYEALSPEKAGEFDTHMAGNTSNTQSNLDRASSKLSELTDTTEGLPAEMGSMRGIGTSRSILGRAMGDPDGTMNVGSSLLSGASNGRNLDDISQIGRGLDNSIGGGGGITQDVKSLGRTIMSGASNLHADVQSGADMVGRFAQSGSKMVSDVGQGLSKGMDAGIGVGEGLVDSLGPIGDIIGLGMAIFGGIKSHQEHKEEQASVVQNQATISSLPSTQSSNTASVGVGGSSMNPLQSQNMGHY